jgi:putative FmdB family regulatory protein
MPIYEYRCAACGHTLETMQKVSDPAPELCPACNAKGPLERLVSRTSFQLKGGGWYSDLYGSVKKDAKSPEGSAPAAPAEKADKPAAPATPATTSSTSSTTSAAPASGGAGGAKGGGSAAP